MPEYNRAYYWPSADGDCFDRAQALSTTPGMNGWTVKDTSATGSPTYLCTSGVGMKLTLDNAVEAQVVTMYHNDVLMFALNELKTVEFIAKVAGIGSNSTLVMGIASAQNDTADSVATNAWFRIQGSVSTSNVLAETDDGTTDNDDVATGTTLSSTLKKFVIDFSNGLSDVRFYIDGARVAESTTFSMAALSSTTNVQPFVQVQKASSADLASVTINWWRMTHSKVYN